MKIGEIMASDREITLNEGKKAVTILSLIHTPSPRDAHESRMPSSA